MRNIKRLLVQNQQLRKIGKRIISKLNQDEWPTNGIAAKEIPQLTDRLAFRALSVGALGGMMSFLGIPTLQKIVVPFFAEESVLYSMILISYLLGAAAATKLSYRINFFNPFAELNELSQLHAQFQANCEQLRTLRHRSA